MSARDAVVQEHEEPQSSHGGCIVELREFINNEDYELKEKSIKDVTNDCPNCNLFIHDLCCHCDFTDKGYVDHMLLDKYLLTKKIPHSH